MWVSPGPSVVFRVSACLWTWTLTFRGVQVGSREWLGGDWIIVTMPSHQTPGSGGSWSQGNCVSVWTMTMLCQMTQGCVTHWSVILFEQIFDLGNDTPDARETWFYQQFIATLKYFRLLEMFRLSIPLCSIEMVSLHKTSYILRDYIYVELES